MNVKGEHVAEEFVVFKLDGDEHEYRLAFDFNEICAAEVVAGCNLMSVLGGHAVDAAQTRGLLYACLKKGHPRVLLAEAGGLLTRDMTTTLGALNELLREAGMFEEPEEVKQPA